MCTACLQMNQVCLCLHCMYCLLGKGSISGQDSIGALWIFLNVKIHPVISLSHKLWLQYGRVPYISKFRCHSFAIFHSNEILVFGSVNRREMYDVFKQSKQANHNRLRG